MATVIFTCYFCRKEAGIGCKLNHFRYVEMKPMSDGMDPRPHGVSTGNARFEHKTPTEEQEKLLKQTRLDFEILSARVENMPASRYKSIAQTKLEEAAMWLNKAIVHSNTELDKL